MCNLCILCNLIAGSPRPMCVKRVVWCREVTEEFPALAYAA
jgi:hypothetical protein